MLELDKIYNMDCIQGISQIDDNSIDAVITDPPYGINKKGVNNDESLKIYYDVLPKLFRVLKENTYFITFTSTKRLPEMFINNPFEYVWCGFIYYRNIQRINHCPVGRSKQSMYLVFKKGEPKRHKHISDVQEYLYHGENVINHPAPKPIKCINYLIECFSKEGDVVLDCFMGSGSTAISCLKRNRHFIGFEINKNYYDYSLQRLLNVPKRLENWI